jgi:ATP-dependent Clp protease ATP-binding subunit ClpA
MALLENSDEKFVSELKQVGLNSDTVAAIALKVGNYLPGILSQTKEAESEEDTDEEGSLPYFGRNMNEQAEDEEFLNITGRDKEIDRLIHILARKTKNNPILVGDAGVGKTAVVQGLVQRIVRGDVPPSFLGMTVISFDVPTIIAGSRVRGDVEERILGLVREAIDSGDKIIFIDEIHMIVGQDPKVEEILWTLEIYLSRI